MEKKPNIHEVNVLAPVPIPAGNRSNFGEKRKYETHPGVDINVPVGTKVIAPMDGVVVLSDFNHNPLCGATIDIDYKNGFWSRFCHMSRIDVKKGDVVKQGQLVGLSGGKVNSPGSGNSQGPHLHFTLKKDGTLVDPLKYVNTTVPPSDIQGVQSVAKKLDDEEPFDIETFVKTIKPGQLGDILTKAMTTPFMEEVRRIKQLLK